MHRKSTVSLLPVGVIGLILVAFASTPAAEPDSTPQPALPRKATQESRLQHLLCVSPRMLSGGEPHSEEAFAELARRGVKTVVSVDGARPDVEAAQRHGLRYVHVPIGYDGLDEHAQRSLVRVMRDTKGTVYVHCHHGKHRGPAAAAVACLATGDLSPRTALDYLALAGTGKEYAGLWRDVAEFQPPPADASLPELVAVAEVDSLAAAMADLDRAWDRLKLCAAADWQTPRDHADLAAAHEALLVWEALRESRRMTDERHRKLGDDLDAAVQLAQQLRVALAAGDHATAAREFTALSASCTSCHAAHRN